MGDDGEDSLRRLAKEDGVEIKNKADRMRSGTTHLADQAEHVIDIDTEIDHAIVAAASVGNAASHVEID